MPQISLSKIRRSGFCLHMYCADLNEQNIVTKRSFATVWLARSMVHTIRTIRMTISSRSRTSSWFHFTSKRNLV